MTNETKTEIYLRCLTSATVLQIVKKHEIHFDYQEVAIIRKFNEAFKNNDVFDGDAGDIMGDENDQFGNQDCKESEGDPHNDSKTFASDPQVAPMIRSDDPSQGELTE